MFKEVPSQFDFPKAELEVLAFWEANDIYEKSLEKSKGGKPFVFFEGPPTANGLPHPGHCLTRAIKDLFPRYKTMTGHYCLRKGGWDTHGLPVEVEVCKELGIHSKEEIETYGIEAFNRRCLESVFRYTREWEELTRRLGFWVNLEEAYVTYHQSYIESVWWALKTLFDAGKLHQGYKIVWWWAQGGTALSAGEVGQGYREVDDPSVFVRFPLVEDERFRELFGGDKQQGRDRPEQSRDRKGAVDADTEGPSPSRGDPSLTVGALKEHRVSLLVWTTTPWTLPSNMFAAVHRDFDYALVCDDTDGERLIFAQALVDPIAKKLKAKGWRIERTFKGEELIGLRYVPPFPECYYKNPAKGMVASTTPGSADFVDTTWGEATWLTASSQEERIEIIGGRETRPRIEEVDTSTGKYKHLAWRVVHGDFVTLDSGTGLVHEAPAFGEVDFELWKSLNREFSQAIRFEGQPRGIPLFCSVAPNGMFTADMPKYAGRWVKDCDKEIVQDMKQRKVLVWQEQYRHDYPFCWRAEEDPLIQYPRKSWFIRTTDFKNDMLENNRQINWLPEHIKAGRFGKFLESNVDWALSRERYWGTPLPIWVCRDDGCRHMEAIDSYDALVNKPGVDGLGVWEAAKRQSPELSEHLKVHRPYIDAITYECPKCASKQSRDREGAVQEQSRDRKGAVRAVEQGPLPDGRGSDCRMQRVPDVIDCWFDSGAMPFAQWGFPHKNAEMFGSQFPADFISEALDQTRGWFYSLVAISTLLFGEQGVARNNPQSAIGNPRYPHPFRNCIVLGLLMGEDGQKMSKSKKNYREPGYIFEHEGADAMRWLFFSGQTPWTSIRFQESTIAEGQREFLIRLYNCYSFFVIYANIDKWTPDQNRDREGAVTDQSRGPSRLHDNPSLTVGALTELDRWTLSELNRCCLGVFDRMEAYDSFNACKALNEFVDALSNWYVRRSRERFWRSGMDDDKKAAYATLYECLVTLSKLIAPFTPFFAESMHQNLVRTHNPEAPLSVHLCDYPITEATRAEAEKRIDQRLIEDVERVRQLVSCGRAARNAAKLRVRQPLARMELYHRDADVVRRHEGVICDELNIKRIEYVSAAEIDKYVQYELKPDFKKIGPKHGPLAPKIKAALTACDNVELLVKALEEEGRCIVNVDGQVVRLEADEVTVELHAREGWSAARVPGWGILVLDAHLTPELRDEGLARDLVNQVQQIRKQLNLRYEQRIDLAVIGDADVRRVVDHFGKYVMGETLAQSLLSKPLAGTQPVTAEVEGHAVELYVHPL